MITVKDGQIVISELNSMNECPSIPEGEMSVFVMVFLKFTCVPVIVQIDKREIWPHSAYHGIGWIECGE